MLDHTISDHLWNKIRADTAVSRGLLVAYIKAVCKEARAIPIVNLAKPELINQRQNMEHEGIGVESRILVSLAQQDKIDADFAGILSLCSQLDMSPENQQLWQELFKKVDNL